MEVPPPPASRLMQVKVLYTFNDENKSNCLARCQQPLQIQTAHLDSSTEIGIIELRTCIQAIVTASPELVAQLGQDYTIYAYDYSEYETPLVGQGMLSWVLASASSTPNAPAHQSKTMVTGRVCKNVLGLFSEGIKETLEVKLRLVPVPTCLQSEYLASMEKYRSTSTVVGQSSFDTAAWSTFLRANPTFGAADPIPTSPTILAPQPQHKTSNGAGQSISVHTDSASFDPSFHTLELARPVQTTAPSSSRPATPSQSRPQTQKRKNPPSRPSSRASGCGGRRNSKQAAQQLDTSEAENGPVRKRARVTKADWNGTSAFGNNTESLRVTAATAASIRGDRPASAHPSASDLAAAEPGIRPPTPRPQGLPRKTKPKSLTRSVTNMAHDILTNPSSNHDSPYLADQTASPETSPEKRDDSSTSTPFDLPSSPPVIADPSPAPSSPQLPVLPFHDDSGFMSGNFDDDEYLDDGALPLDTEDLLVTGRYKSKMNEVHSDVPSSDFVVPQSRLHPRSFSDPQQPPFENIGGTTRWTAQNGTRSALRNLALGQDDSLLLEPRTEPAHSLQPDAEDENETASRNLPTISDARTCPHQDNSSSLDGLSRQRSESCAVENTSAAGSPAALPDVRPPKGRQNSLMHEKKKQSVQDHLANAIKAGQMPRFCKNCGEISTPTWRKAFVKVQEGTPDPVTLPDVQNGLITWEAIEKDGKGTVLSYRLIKKYTTQQDAGFEAIDLCNSCGVWLFKHRCMRPPEAWNKPDGPKPPPKPKKRPSRRKGAENKVGEPEQQDTNHEASDIGEAEEGGCADSEGLSLSREDSTINSEGGAFKKPRLERASSVTVFGGPKEDQKVLDSRAAKAALKRAIQSSPPRFPGSQFTPIEIDLESESTPKPTRRLLFPSPRKPGEMKSLEDPSDSPSTSKSFAKGKENQRPAEDSDDELDHLFNNEDDVKSLQTPKTNEICGDPSKTPARTRSASAKRRGLLSSASRRLRHSNPSTPSRAANQTFMLDPEQMTPFTRQLTQLISEANQGSDGIDAPFGQMEGGMFAFSDFQAEEMGMNSEFDASNIGTVPIGLYNDYLGSSDGLWSSEDMDRTIDAFLQGHETSKHGAAENL